MKLPTDHQIQRLVDRLRDLTKVDPATSRTRLDDLETRTLALRQRATTGNLELDATGVPATAVQAAVPIGLTRAQRTLVVNDENGHPDAVPVTAVEATAIPNADARLTGHDLALRHDVITEDFAKVIDHLRTGINALDAARTRLDHADRVSSPLSRAENAGGGHCLCCGTWVSGAANDRLRRGLRMPCYMAWVRAGRPDLTTFIRTRRPDEEATA